MAEGIEKAWEELKGLEPADVTKRASVSYDDGCYVLRSLGMDFRINPDEKAIESMSAGGEVLIKKFGYFFNLSAVWYLVLSKEIEPTGRHLKPESLKGGDVFFKGTHKLPLGGVAHKYGSDRDGFLDRVAALGGKTLGEYGDAAAELYPLPRVPVTLILWLGDEEFPPRADLLMDSSCEIQLPLDIIWSVAMFSVLMML
jgi:hypothetical protein